MTIKWHINDDTALVEIGDGAPWEAIDDTYCQPDGAWRQYVEGMVKRGILVDDGKLVRPFDPSATIAAREKVKAAFSTARN